MLDYTKIPVDYMVDGVKRYVEDGILTGSFLTSLMENDLVHTFANADSNNMAHIKEWAGFLYWEMPMSAWGNRERVQAWIKRGGLNENSSAKK